MSHNELETISERVKVYFLEQVIELSNNEVEVVLDELARYFDEWLEKVRQATHKPDHHLNRRNEGGDE